MMYDPSVDPLSMIHLHYTVSTMHVWSAISLQTTTLFAFGLDKETQKNTHVHTAAWVF